jgi:hypothetical protein
MPIVPSRKRVVQCATAAISRLGEGLYESPEMVLAEENALETELIDALP